MTMGRPTGAWTPVRSGAWALVAACSLGVAGCGDDDSEDDATTQAAASTAGKTAAHALWAAQGTALNLQASQQAQSGRSNPALAGSAAGTDVQQQLVLPCTGGGSADVNVASLIPFTLSAAFTGCTQSVVVLNGSLSLTATGFFVSGALLSFDSVATDFEVAVGPVAQRLNGDSHVSIDSLAPVTLSASSSSLSTQSLMAGVVTSSLSLSGLQARLVIDTGASTVTSTTDFIASGSFTGLGEATLQVQTLDPLVTPLGAVLPTSGQLRITRDQLEVTTLTVLGSTTRLEVDNNGDGVIDSTEDIATGDLFALLD